MKDTSKVPAEPSKCLICGNPAELGVYRGSFRKGVKQQFFPQSKHRTVPVCGWCSVKYSEPCGADLAGDGPAREIPGHNFVPGRLDSAESGGVATDDYLPMTAEDRLIALYRKAGHRLQDAAMAMLEAGAK